MKIFIEVIILDVHEKHFFKFFFLSDFSFHSLIYLVFQNILY